MPTLPKLTEEQIETIAIASALSGELTVRETAIALLGLPDTDPSYVAAPDYLRIWRIRNEDGRRT